MRIDEVCSHCGGTLYIEESNAKILTLKCINCSRPYFRLFNDLKVYKTYREAAKMAGVYPSLYSY